MSNQVLKFGPAWLLAYLGQEKVGQEKVATKRCQEKTSEVSGQAGCGLAT